MTLEVIHYPAEGGRKGPPLLFVHGAFTGAWVWDEHFLPWFRTRGHDVHALSFRGHGNSSGRGSLQDFCIRDYEEDLRQVAESFSEPPVIIAHSMGGYVAQKYLEQDKAAAMVLIASVPPTGVAGTAATVAVHNPVLMWKIALGQSFGDEHAEDAALRKALFSERVSEETVDGFMPRVQAESRQAALDMYGPDFPDALLIGALPVLVMGGRKDQLTPVFHLKSTAAVYGTQALVFPDMGHAMMLEPGWEDVAEAILGWLSEKGLHGG